MLNETFYLDHVDARSMGIRLQKPLEFDAAEPVIETESVSGRNGDFVFFSGSYENRGGYASCYALEKNVISKIDKINKWLLSNPLYRRLESSDDPEHFWQAMVSNSAELAQRNRLLNPFEIDFDCKPQRFRKDGEKTIEFLENGFLDNPGMPARPLIYVQCKGTGLLTIGCSGVEIINFSGLMILDSEEQDAYNEYGSLNNTIYAEDFPVLKQGRNRIEWSGGIEKVEIVPRWWDL